MRISPQGGRLLIDVLVGLVQEHGLSGHEIGRRYNVSRDWYKDVKSGKTKSPNVTLVQLIVEDLTGSPLYPLEDK